MTDISLKTLATFAALAMASCAMDTSEPENWNYIVLHNQTDGCGLRMTSSTTGRTFDIPAGTAEDFRGGDGCRTLSFSSPECGFVFPLGAREK